MRLPLQSWLLGHLSHNGSHQVFTVGSIQEFLSIFFCNNHCHSFLRFADGKLGAVQTVVLFRYQIQINFQSVCQLADSNRNATCTKVVASFDHAGHIAVAEQALNLSFFRWVALLHLCAAAGQRLYIVGLGGTGCTAAAVASGFAAQ